MFDTPPAVNDLISSAYGLYALWALAKLVRGWQAFWDREITAADRGLAGELAFFVFIPIGVLLHEAGHTLATWQLGGFVVDFQWRVFWGYIIPIGIFTPLENWWIALAGNIVSILLGILPILALPYTRNSIWGELCYAFARHELIYALIWYPALSLAGFGGDWAVIYDFSVAPYAQITLGAHVALLVGLWLLDNSKRATLWRIRHNAPVLAAWQSLEAKAAANPEAAAPLAMLAYVAHHVGERRTSGRLLRQAGRRDAASQDVMFSRARIAYEEKRYAEARRAAETFLKGESDPMLRRTMYLILGLCLMETGKPAESLEQFDTALGFASENWELYYWRAMAKRKLGRRDEARLDLYQAARFVADETNRATIERELAGLKP